MTSRPSTQDDENRWPVTSGHGLAEPTRYAFCRVCFSVVPPALPSGSQIRPHFDASGWSGFETPAHTEVSKDERPETRE